MKRPQIMLVFSMFLLAAGLGYASGNNEPAQVPIAGDGHCCPEHSPWLRDGTHSCYRDRHSCEGHDHHHECHYVPCHDDHH